MDIQIVFNWKTYIRTEEDAVNLAKEVCAQAHATTIICPSDLHIAAVAEVIQGSSVKLGAQDVASLSDGPQTGRTTGAQLSALGVSYCLIGHSETRGEGLSNEIIAQKVRHAQTHKLTSIVLVNDISQLEAVRAEMSDSSIAVFEPTAYIGKATAMPLDQIQEAIKGMRSIFKGSILYGGSVDAENTAGILEAGVNGFLVGRAGVDPVKLRTFLSVF